MLVKPNVSEIPEQPGVYIFKDAKGKMIYVGKALSLRKRLISYFDNSHRPAKTQYMLKWAEDLDYIITNNEVEALLLEANLIKTEKPRYNILLKDSKGYPYIKVTKGSFPRVLFTRDTSDNTAEYFGPFVDAQNLRGILRSLLKVFPLRSCSDSRFKKGETCINYQIKRCKGPCAGLISREHYLELVDEIKYFFKGDVRNLKNTLDNEMKRYASMLMFEEAAEVRNRIESLDKLFINQKVVFNTDKHIDSFVFGSYKNVDYVNMSFVRNGKLIGVDTKIVDENEHFNDIFTFVLQFYSLIRQYPDEILVYPQADEKRVLLFEKAFQELSKKKIIMRRRGLNNLISIAESNGQNYVKHFLQKKDTAHQMQKRLRKLLNINNDIKSIQCVDISHLSGDMTVGASIFWDADNGFLKNNYRLYNLKNLSNNDVEAIYQLISRKAANISEGSEEKSDLYLIDGGVAQLNAAVKAFGENMMNVNICAISKGRSRNSEKFDNEESIEEMHVPGRKNSIHLKRNDRALLLVSKIRDEAHRFVISSLRKKALKNYRKSPLLQVKGVGEKRVKLLLTEFPDIYSRQDITAAEMAEKCRIPAEVCEKVLDFVKNYDRDNT